MIIRKHVLRLTADDGTSGTSAATIKINGYDLDKAAWTANIGRNVGAWMQHQGLNAELRELFQKALSDLLQGLDNGTYTLNNNTLAGRSNEMGYYGRHTGLFKGYGDANNIRRREGYDAVGNAVAYLNNLYSAMYDQDLAAKAKAAEEAKAKAAEDEAKMKLIENEERTRQAGLSLWNNAALRNYVQNALFGELPVDWDKFRDDYDKDLVDGVNPVKGRIDRMRGALSGFNIGDYKFGTEQQRQDIQTRLNTLLQDSSTKDDWKWFGFGDDDWFRGSILSDEDALSGYINGESWGKNPYERTKNPTEWENVERARATKDFEKLVSGAQAFDYNNENNYTKLPRWRDLQDGDKYFGTDYAANLASAHNFYNLYSNPEATDDFMYVLDYTNARYTYPNIGATYINSGTTLKVFSNANLNNLGVAGISNLYMKEFDPKRAKSAKEYKGLWLADMFHNLLANNTDGFDRNVYMTYDNLDFSEGTPKSFVYSEGAREGRPSTFNHNGLALVDTYSLLKNMDPDNPIYKEILKQYLDYMLKLKHKDGGIIKAQFGAIALKKREELADIIQADIAKQHQQGYKATNRENAANRQIADNFSALELARIGAAAADLGAGTAAWFGPFGSAVSGVLGLGSTATNLIADMSDDAVSGWDVVKGLGFNLGMDLVGLLPGLGFTGKTAKALKGIAKLAPKMVAIGSTIGIAPDAIAAFKKLGNDEKMTSADIRNIAYGLSALAGMSRMGAASYNKRKRFAGPTGNGETVNVTVKDGNNRVMKTINKSDLETINQSLKDGDKDAALAALRAATGSDSVDFTSNIKAKGKNFWNRASQLEGSETGPSVGERAAWIQELNVANKEARKRWANGNAFLRFIADNYASDYEMYGLPRILYHTYNPFDRTTARNDAYINEAKQGVMEGIAGIQAARSEQHLIDAKKAAVDAVIAARNGSDPNVVAARLALGTHTPTRTLEKNVADAKTALGNSKTEALRRDRQANLFDSRVTQLLGEITRKGGLTPDQRQFYTDNSKYVDTKAITLTPEGIAARNAEIQAVATDRSIPTGPAKRAAIKAVRDKWDDMILKVGDLEERAGIAGRVDQFIAMRDAARQKHTAAKTASDQARTNVTQAAQTLDLRKLDRKVLDRVSTEGGTRPLSKSEVTALNRFRPGLGDLMQARRTKARNIASLEQTALKANQDLVDFRRVPTVDRAYVTNRTPTHRVLQDVLSGKMVADATGNPITNIRNYRNFLKEVSKKNITSDTLADLLSDKTFMAQVRSIYGFKKGGKVKKYEDPPAGGITGPEASPMKKIYVTGSDGKKYFHLEGLTQLYDAETNINAPASIQLFNSNSSLFTGEKTDKQKEVERKFKKATDPEYKHALEEVVLPLGTDLSTYTDPTTGIKYNTGIKYTPSKSASGYEKPVPDQTQPTGVDPSITNSVLSGLDYVHALRQNARVYDNVKKLRVTTKTAPQYSMLYAYSPVAQLQMLNYEAVMNSSGKQIAAGTSDLGAGTAIRLNAAMRGIGARQLAELAYNEAQLQLLGSLAEINRQNAFLRTDIANGNRNAWDAYHNSVLAADSTMGAANKEATSNLIKEMQSGITQGYQDADKQGLEDYLTSIGLGRRPASFNRKGGIMRFLPGGAFGSERTGGPYNLYLTISDKYWTLKDEYDKEKAANSTNANWTFSKKSELDQAVLDFLNAIRQETYNWRQVNKYTNPSAFAWMGRGMIRTPKPLRSPDFTPELNDTFKPLLAKNGGKMAEAERVKNERFAAKLFHDTVHKNSDRALKITNASGLKMQYLLKLMMQK